MSVIFSLLTSFNIHTSHPSPEATSEEAKNDSLEQQPDEPLGDTQKNLAANVGFVLCDLT